jgi:hypothetical protein
MSGVLFELRSLERDIGINTSINELHDKPPFYRFNRHNRAGSVQWGVKLRTNSDSKGRRAGAAQIDRARSVKTGVNGVLFEPGSLDRDVGINTSINELHDKPPFYRFNRHNRAGRFFTTPEGRCVS